MTYQPQWRKSSYSGSQGDCVELANLGGSRGMRDSKLGDASPVLNLTPSQLAGFLAGAKAGEFDHLI